MSECVNDGRGTKCRQQKLVRKIQAEMVPQIFSEEQKQQWVEFWSKFCCPLAEGN